MLMLKTLRNIKSIKPRKGRVLVDTDSRGKLDRKNELDNKSEVSNNEVSDDKFDDNEVLKKKNH